MRRLDGLPPQRKPTRYLLFPPGQGWRYRPLPGASHSHVAISYKDAAMKEGQQYRKRRTLCGLVFDVKTSPWMRLDKKRYLGAQPIEWDRVTCAHCLRYEKKIR